MSNKDVEPIDVVWGTMGEKSVRGGPARTGRPIGCGGPCKRRLYEMPVKYSGGGV